MEGEVGLDRLLAAPEDHRVAALDAERGGVGRDVRAALVDEEDHAERDADLRHVEAVGAAARRDDLAHRVGQGDDRLQGLRDLLQPPLVEAAGGRSPRDSGRSRARRRGRGRWRRGSRPIAGGSTPRGALQPGVLGRPRRHGQRPRRDLGAVGQVVASRRDLVGLVMRIMERCPNLRRAPDFQGIHRRPDVVDPHHARPPGDRRQGRRHRGGRPLVRPAGRSGAPAAPCATRRPGRRNPRLAKRPRFRKSSRLCACVLPNPMPGIDRDPSAGYPRSPRHVRPGVARILVNLGRRVVVPGVDLHRRGGCPAMCIRTTPAPASATTRAISGSPSAVMSLTTDAPAASARRATSALLVSIEIGGDPLGREGLDHRDHPAQLLSAADGLGARAGSIRRRRRAGRPPRPSGDRRRARASATGSRPGRRRRSCRA